MTDCAAYKQTLPLFGSDDLEESRRAALETHLRTCVKCASEVADYERLVSDLKTALAIEATLPLGAVTRIASQAAENALRPPFWSRLLPPIPVHGWGAAVPAMLLAAVISVPFLLSHETARPVAQAPVRLDMQVDGNGVKVAWSNGHNRTYRVYKTTDPRRLGSGSGQVVRGHEWVDRDPGNAAIVYYRVE